MDLGNRVFCQLKNSNGFRTSYGWWRKELLQDYEWFDWRIPYYIRRDIDERLYQMWIGRTILTFQRQFKWRTLRRI